MIVGLIFLFFLEPQAHAHIVGVTPWCLANSPVHFECFQEDHELCVRTAQKRTTAFERWDCVPFPVDFRRIPKTGEGSVSPESSGAVPTPKKPSTNKFDL